MFPQPREQAIMSVNAQFQKASAERRTCSHDSILVLDGQTHHNVHFQHSVSCGHDWRGALIRAEKVNSDVVFWSGGEESPKAVSSKHA